MKRKIGLAFLLLLTVFAVGAVIASRYVAVATDEFQGLIEMHQIENLRRALVINLQDVQAALYEVRKPSARDLDAIVASVTNLKRASTGCSSCHHGAAVTDQLEEVRRLLKDYETELSHYITARANRERIQRFQLKAAAVGDQILQRTEAMSLVASERLQRVTLQAADRIKRVRLILLATGLGTLLCGLLVGVRLSRAVTEPIRELSAATRALASGSLGHEIEAPDTAEFAELARHFNAMSRALRDGYERINAINQELEAEVAERRRIEEDLRLNEYRLKSILDLHGMSDASPEELAGHVLDRAVRLTGSEMGFLGFFDPDGREIVLHAASPTPMPQCAVAGSPGHFALEAAGVWAEAVRGRDAVILNDYASADLPKRGLPEGHAPIQRLLSIPVLDQDRVVGVAAVANKEGEYRETDAQQLILLMHGMWEHVRRRRTDEVLLRAQKLESLGVLAGGIAHDFNNLLTGVLANVTLAECHLADPDKARTRLRAVEKASLRAQGLTQQLLTFSKGGAPIKQIAPLGDLIRDSARFALSGAAVSCEFSIPEGTWATAFDPGQMGQVISNLIINAEQAMPQGGVVRVGCENVVLGEGSVPGLAPGRYVVIAVADQGCGIPKANLPRIFDPYFTTKPGGSGLGLATSYSVIHQHGGEIAVDSEPGQGARFRIYLPASDTMEDTPVPAHPSAEHPEGAGGKVLVMDDEEAIREVTGEMLEIAGYEFALAKDGAEAVALYRSALAAGEPFAVVVLDLTVPGGMGGQEAMRMLQQVDPGVRGIVASGYSEDPVMAAFEQHGFRARIAKPYRMEHFLRVLRGVACSAT